MQSTENYVNIENPEIISMICIIAKGCGASKGSCQNEMVNFLVAISALYKYTIYVNMLVGPSNRPSVSPSVRLCPSVGPSAGLRECSNVNGLLYTKNRSLQVCLKKTIVCIISW